jgi:hypothetical protein
MTAGRRGRKRVPDEQHGLGFVLFHQDWRGHRFGDPEPPVIQTRFATRGEAEEHKSQLRQQFPDTTTTLLCVTPAPQPRPRKAKRR